MFSDPRIVPWRSIAERQNCTLDVSMPDGRGVRLHVKRCYPVRGRETPAEAERRGIELLERAGIGTTPLVGHGRLADGRSFIITEDLAGFRAGDRWVADRETFERVLGPTAELAAKLHNAGLHHRDLYLCHFFIKENAGAVELRLIDAARVKRLPGLFFRRRWVVKDLAQFWYSTFARGVSDEQRGRWLVRYGEARGIGGLGRLRTSVERKAARIARHDARLEGGQPGRNVSIPGG